EPVVGHVVRLVVAAVLGVLAGALGETTGLTGPPGSRARPPGRPTCTTRLTGHPRNPDAIHPGAGSARLTAPPGGLAGLTDAARSRRVGSSTARSAWSTRAVWSTWASAGLAETWPPVPTRAARLGEARHVRRIDSARTPSRATGTSGSRPWVLGCRLRTPRHRRTTQCRRLLGGGIAAGEVVRRRGALLLTDRGHPVVVVPDVIEQSVVRGDAVLAQVVRHRGGPDPLTDAVEADRIRRLRVLRQPVDVEAAAGPHHRRVLQVLQHPDLLVGVELVPVDHRATGLVGAVEDTRDAQPRA